MFKPFKPIDPYSSEWSTFWAANPSLHRGVGAEAAVAETDDAAVTDIVKPDADKAAADAAAKVVTKTDKEDNWRSDLPDDLKETANRFTSKADAVRAIADFRKRESQVRVPGKDATPEQIAAYQKAVGVPDKPELYEFPDLPEGLELTDQVKESRTQWGKRFHTLGVSKETAKELSKLVNEDVVRELSAQKEADKAFATKQEEALRNEWKGDEYERNKTLANRAFSDLANRTGLKLDDLTRIETKDGRFLMDRAEIVKMFAVIGREMSEGSLGPTLTESEKDTMDDQIRNIRTQTAEAQSAGDSKRANALYQQEQALIARREGSKPVVGARGRMV